MNSFMDFGIHLACQLRSHPDWYYVEGDIESACWRCIGKKFMPESLLILPNDRAYNILHYRSRIKGNKGILIPSKARAYNILQGSYENLAPSFQGRSASPGPWQLSCFFQGMATERIGQVQLELRVPPPIVASFETPWTAATIRSASYGS